MKWDQRFLQPLGTGVVQDRDKSTVVVSLGTDDGVYPGDQLNTSNLPPGTLEVVTATAEQCVARIISEDEGVPIKKGELVSYGQLKFFTPPTTPDATSITNSERLAGMKGWAIAWDEQNSQSHSDGKRRAVMRVFPDGRIAAVYGANAPLVQGRIDAKEVSQLVEQLSKQGTKRDINKLFPIQNKSPMLAGEYDALQTSVQRTAKESNIGDPLPHTLWDQTANRITVVHDGEMVDLMTIEPPHLERPDPANLADVAGISKETHRRLLELIYIATFGGNEHLAQCVAFANAQLRLRDPNTVIELFLSDIHWASRRDDHVEAMFYFSAKPDQLSFPSGEILVGRDAGKNWLVKKAKYRFDAETNQRWGNMVTDESSQHRGESHASLLSWDVDPEFSHTSIHSEVLQLSQSIEAESDN